MWQEFFHQLHANILGVAILGITLTTIFAYLFLALKIRDDKTVDLRDLVLDSRTRRLDYKKLAINTCAVLQCYTWWRMSNGLPVDTALYNPMLWVVFYAVVAGHDLLYRIVKIKAAQVGVGTNDNSDQSPK